MKPEKTMLRKAALLFLIAAMLSVLFASCKSREPEAPQGTAASTGTRAPDESGDPGGEDPPPVEVLPDVDYSAFDFKMLLRDNDYYVSDMYVEEPDASSTQMDQEVFRRNQAVHERLGIQFSLDRSSSNNLDTDALNSILTGMNDYDLIANHGRGMFSYATNGALANWYELEWVDLPVTPSITGRRMSGISRSCRCRCMFCRAIMTAFQTTSGWQPSGIPASSVWPLAICCF